jgi:hypothetical protein
MPRITLRLLVARYPNSNRSIDGCFCADANVVLSALFQVLVDRATYKLGGLPGKQDCMQTRDIPAIVGS